MTYTSNITTSNTPEIHTGTWKKSKIKIFLISTMIIILKLIKYKLQYDK